MKKAWSIGKRIFSDNFERRVKLFKALAGTVALYGAEVWAEEVIRSWTE